MIQKQPPAILSLWDQSAFSASILPSLYKLQNNNIIAWLLTSLVSSTESVGKDTIYSLYSYFYCCFLNNRLDTVEYSRQ